MKSKKKIDSSLYYDIDKDGNKVLKKKGWFKRLFDMNDNSVSASTAFMVVTAIVGTFLLIVPGVALLIEVLYNHTITTDLTGMGAYIASVSTLFLQGGFLKGWTNYTSYKYNVVTSETMQQDIEEESQSIVDQDEIDMNN